MKTANNGLEVFSLDRVLKVLAVGIFMLTVLHLAPSWAMLSSGSKFLMPSKGSSTAQKPQQIKSILSNKSNKDIQIKGDIQSRPFLSAAIKACVKGKNYITRLKLGETGVEHSELYESFNRLQMLKENNLMQDILSVNNSDYSDVIHEVYRSKAFARYMVDRIDKNTFKKMLSTKAINLLVALMEQVDWKGYYIGPKEFLDFCSMAQDTSYHYRLLMYCPKRAEEMVSHIEAHYDFFIRYPKALRDQIIASLLVGNPVATRALLEREYDKNFWLMPETFPELITKEGFDQLIMRPGGWSIIKKIIKRYPRGLGTMAGYIDQHNLIKIVNHSEGNLFIKEILACNDGARVLATHLSVENFDKLERTDSGAALMKQLFDEGFTDFSEIFASCVNTSNIIRIIDKFGTSLFSPYYLRKLARNVYDVMSRDYFEQFLETSDRVHVLQYLAAFQPHLREQLCGYIDSKILIKFASSFEGVEALEYLIRDWAPGLETATFNISKGECQELLSQEWGLRALIVLSKKIPSCVNNVIANMDQHMWEELAEHCKKQGDSVVSLGLLCKAEQDVAKHMIRVLRQDHLIAFALHGLGMGLIHNMVHLGSEKFDNLAKTNTGKHILHYDSLQRRRHDYLFMPAQSNHTPFMQQLVNQCLSKESELYDTHYTFIHGQRREYYLPEKLHTLLWSIENNKQLNDFVFAHVKPFPSSNELEEDGEMHSKLLAEGRYDYPSRQRLLFLNYAFFGNDSNVGSSSASYIHSNSNVGRVSLSCEQVLKQAKMHEVYAKHAGALFDLERRYNNLSTHGNALLVAVPKDKARQCLYPAVTGGGKKSVEIEGIGQTTDIIEVMETLRNAPHKLVNKIDSDQIEFCLIMSWKNGGLDPESGIKVIPMVTGDPIELAKLEKEREELFAKIESDIRAYKQNVSSMQDSWQAHA